MATVLTAPADKPAPAKKPAPTKKPAPARKAPAKKAAAKTPTKKPAAPVHKASDGRLPPAAKIKVTADANTRRPGTAAHKQIELLRGSKTVAEFVEKGGRVGYLRTEIAKGRVKVEPAA